jgi:hypothetical protein
MPQTIRTINNLDCVALENDSLSILVTQSAGPRIISLRYKDGQNLFAELPDSTVVRPDGKIYHFYGGHRLWHAPENMPRTYALDDQPVEIVSVNNGLQVTQQVEAETGIQKSLQISLVQGKPQVIIQHTLTNFSQWTVECAIWALTQLKTGGVAILPQSQEPSGLLSNRALAIWQYADLNSPYLKWGNNYLLFHSEMQAGQAFKIGFPNPRGWLAYWLAGTLFVKHAAFQPQVRYNDNNSSSEFFCNDRFLELETLGPVSSLPPQTSITHTETWELFNDVDFPSDEKAVDVLVKKLGLE